MSLARFALHGGAGVIDRKLLSPTREAQYRDEMQRIAAQAWAALANGAPALDVVEQAVRQLEDCPLFNAGHGAVLNRDGVAELDAAIMDGRNRAAGAVGACFAPRYPISLARAILEQGDHVMLVGPNADRFALARGLECVDPAYFLTADRQHQLALALAEGRISLDHDNVQQAPDQPSPQDKTGTVGAVARDQYGNLAAATSTGGMTNKCPGRLGDAPIIGAGTWADNQTCAVSATGHGEYFIRCVVGYDIHARMAYGGQSLVEAAQAVLRRVGEMGGTGGLIAIGADGTVSLPMNSEGMYRAWVGADGRPQVAIYR
jgi:isoaspartyl peptidase/L-asparaginase-like protein (Ntn-hydrolase superfamily)